MSTKKMSLNAQLAHAFRTGSLPPSEDAERSFECERAVKAVREATGIPDTSGRGATFYLTAGQLLERDLSTLSSGAGSALVSPAERPTLLALLRPYSILASPSLNVTHLSNLVGNVQLPIVSSAQVSGFVAQTAAFQTGDLQFGLPCTLTPHLLTAQLAVSRTLLYSAGMDLEAGVIAEILASLGNALDAAALTSDGTLTATKGVIATAGVNTSAFGAAATYPQLLAMQTPVLQSNPRLNSVAWIASNPTREKLMQKPKAATAGTGFCWDENDQIGNWPAFANSNLDASNFIVCGDWRSLICATWGPEAISVTVDPYTAAAKNQVKIYAGVLADIAVARPAAFSCSSDSAAQ